MNTKYLFLRGFDITKHFMFWICYILTTLSFSSFAQTGTITGDGTLTYNSDGSVTVTGSKIFTSHIIKSGEDVLDMVQLDAISLFRLNADLKGGIKCTMPNEGQGLVTLTVYSFNGNTYNKGNILYKVATAISQPNDFGGDGEYIPIPGESGEILSDQIKTLLSGADTWLVDRSRCLEISDPNDLNLFKTTIAYLNGQVDPNVNSPIYNCLKGNNYSLLQPVIVEVKVENATVLSQGLKFPGMDQEFDLRNYFNDDFLLTTHLNINGVFKQIFKGGNNPNEHIENILMGDKVSFEVWNYSNEKPQIIGAPAVWIARFAGDLMYYCSPSVTPGEFAPWIGYDSRVHTLQMRNYSNDPSFSVQVPDWHEEGIRKYWSFVAQRRMDANTTKYNAEHTWIKYKILANGAKQRNNQREGLNVQFLNYWQNGQNSDFKEYLGEAKYMMGFDDDELLYLNSQHHDAKNYPPGAGGGIAKLDSIPSRGMPEGYDQIYDVGTGYPAQGFPLNMVISAYRKNREWVVKNNSNYFKRYDGYEIQDLGTDEQNPDGDGTGNNKAPGMIIIRSENKVIRIKVNVNTPFTEDRGFYGSLEGNRWPAYYETNVPYTLNGLKGLSVIELNKFIMEYQGSDALGNLVSQTKFLADLSQSEKENIASTGKWTAYFDNTSPTYASVTAYYRRSIDSERVMIAGKELKSIFLLFIGEKGLEGKGLGAKIWLNDFRETRTDEYSVARKFGNKTKYMKPDVRSYTIPVNTTTVFQAWDGDPHLFYDPGVEWFLSSRTLAKRIPDNYLDGTNPSAEKPYLKYYINNVEQTSGRSGKDFTYTWTTPGEYTLKVEYRIEGGLTSYQHRINVIDYPTGSTGEKTMGKIVFHDLTTQEIQWLGIPNPAIYKVAEVVDVYSQYQYKDGPRANTQYVNRWAEYNDYASRYVWNKDNPIFVQNFITNYSNKDWFWFNWALHYSSNWRDNLPYGLPPYVGNDQVTRVITTELDKFATPIQNLFATVTQARWQYTVPLVSYTDFQGNRMRTNPSCLYDINYIWNNSTGAFSGDVILPTDPSQIQAPDIDDEQKNRQEFYYDLQSGRKIIFLTTDPKPIQFRARNVYGDHVTFIADGYYNP